MMQNEGFLLSQSGHNMNQVQKDLKNSIYHRKLQDYFDDEKSRKYDMLNFLDFYGEKFKLMEIGRTQDNIH